MASQVASVSNAKSNTPAQIVKDHKTRIDNEINEFEKAHSELTHQLDVLSVKRNEIRNAIEDLRRASHQLDEDRDMPCEAECASTHNDWKPVGY